MYWHVLTSIRMKNKRYNCCPAFVINSTQHQVAFIGCSPITAVIIIPVHTLCWGISAPWTNILHCLGNNLCSCRGWVDNILVIRLESKALRRKEENSKQGLIIQVNRSTGSSDKVPSCTETFSSLKGKENRNGTCAFSTIILIGWEEMLDKTVQ